MEGWWCVRHGDELAWVEAPTAAAAVRRSLELHPLGDWTDDVGVLVVFAQDAYPENGGPRDYTRAVLDAGPPARRRRAGPSNPRPPVLACLAAVVVLALGLARDASAETWRGLTVVPEHRCSPYDKHRDYSYFQSVERDIVGKLGAVYGPYTDRCVASTTETDIEHIMAATTAHDSGLWGVDAETLRRFVRDLRSLALVSREVNRGQKSAKDALG